MIRIKAQMVAGLMVGKGQSTVRVQRAIMTR